MYARVLEFTPKMDKREEMVRMVKNEILPILKKQNGFLEILPFWPETTNEKVLTISLWTDKTAFEKYEREWFAKVQEIVRPYVTSPINHRQIVLETRLCEHFERALVA